MVLYGYDKYLTVLGWDETKWENGWESPEEAPETEGLYWNDMTEEQQAAATELCYFEYLWDGYPITDWQEN